MLGRRPALDGLRAIAVVLVLAAHAAVPFTGSAGMVGVTLFFVLSGFLITRLLVEERGRSGRIDLGAFYGRRARRLMPALLMFLAAMAAIMGVVRGAFWRVLAAVTYTTNIVGVDHDMGALGHTWSLATEEQFYLLWPAILVWGARRRPSWLVPGLMAMVVLVSTHRVLLMLSGASKFRVLIAPDTRADALLLGCMTALLIPRLTRRPLGWYAAAGGLVLAASVPAPERTEGVLLIPAMVAAAAIVAWGATVDWAGRGSVLVKLGKISYGVYLWHYPLTMILLASGVAWWLNFPLTFAFSVAVATLSWRLLERPIMDRARRVRTEERSSQLTAA